MHRALFERARAKAPCRGLSNAAGAGDIKSTAPLARRLPERNQLISLTLAPPQQPVFREFHLETDAKNPNEMRVGGSVQRADGSVANQSGALAADTPGLLIGHQSINNLDLSIRITQASSELVFPFSAEGTQGLTTTVELTRGTVHDSIEIRDRAPVKVTSASKDGATTHFVGGSLHDVATALHEILPTGAELHISKNTVVISGRDELAPTNQITARVHFNPSTSAREVGVTARNLTLEGAAIDALT